MVFKKIEGFDNLEIDYISNFSGGYISRNRNLLKHLELNSLTQLILEKSVFGTPIFKLGNGGNRLLILSGIHGNGGGLWPPDHHDLGRPRTGRLRRVYRRGDRICETLWLYKVCAF